MLVGRLRLNIKTFYIVYLLVIVSLILVTRVFDQVGKMKGEINCMSVLGLKVFQERGTEV